MTTSVKLTLAATFAAALTSLASAQIVPPYPAGVNLFADPGPPTAGQYAAGLGDLYFASNADVPSVIQSWNSGPVNWDDPALGGNPFNPAGGSVRTIFVGETAGWKNDFVYANSATPNTFTPLVTKIDDSPTGNIHSGWTTTVEYAAGTSLEFYLNSGGPIGEGGLFSAFGSQNLFAGDDTSSHVRWSVRDVTTTFLSGNTWVTESVPTLLIGFEDTREGVSFYDGDFNDLVVGFQFLPSQIPQTPVPEPSAYSLMAAAGLMGLVALRQFKRRSAA